MLNVEKRLNNLFAHSASFISSSRFKSSIGEWFRTVLCCQKRIKPKSRNNEAIIQTTIAVFQHYAFNSLSYVINNQYPIAAYNVYLLYLYCICARSSGCFLNINAHASRT